MQKCVGIEVFFFKKELHYLLFIYLLYNLGWSVEIFFDQTEQGN